MEDTQRSIRLEKVKKKIRALLSKTLENGATKAEMDASLEKANLLMAEHFIELNDITEEKAKSLLTKKVVRRRPSSYKMTGFIGNLARLFDCEHYWNRSQIVFFGYSHDVEVCAYFYDMIHLTCIKEKENYLLTQDAKAVQLLYRTSAKTIALSFIKGFLKELNSKMQRLRKEKLAKQNNNQWGLIVQNKLELIQTEFKAANPKIRIDQSNLNASIEHVARKGKERAEEFSFTNGIDSGEIVEETKQLS